MSQSKIISPERPSQCVAALSMTEGEEDTPYASIFYTSHEGRITFFGLRVTGVEQGDEGQRLQFAPNDTNPDHALPVVSGTLENGRMTLDTERDIILPDIDRATTFVSIIRMVYSMEAQGA